MLPPPTLEYAIGLLERLCDSQGIEYGMSEPEILFSKPSEEADYRIMIFMDHLSRENPDPSAVAKSQKAAVDAWRKMKKRYPPTAK